MTAGPTLVDRELSPSGTSVTYTGITTTGQELTSTYSWAGHTAAADYLAASEADFHQRLTTAVADQGQRIGRRGRWTFALLTGHQRTWHPRIKFAPMKSQRRRAVLLRWWTWAAALHLGDRTPKAGVAR